MPKALNFIIKFWKKTDYWRTASNGYLKASKNALEKAFSSDEWMLYSILETSSLAIT